MRLFEFVCWTLLFLIWFAAGCGAKYFSASTTATYSMQPDGTKVIIYESNKEQQGLDVVVKEIDDKAKTVTIHVDKASTAEQAIAAALAVQLKLADMLEQLAPLIKAAAMAGS